MSALTPQIAPFIPGCIGRGGAGVNPPLTGPARLATAGVDLTDGTGAIVNTTVAANYSAGLSTASVAIAGAGHFLIGFTVTASGAGSVAIFDRVGSSWTYWTAALPKTRPVSKAFSSALLGP